MIASIHSAVAAGTVLPPSDPTHVLALSDFLERHSYPMALRGYDGEHVPLPREVYEALVHVVTALGRQQAVTVVPIELLLTTQEAADLLGMSHPRLIKLIDDGTVACERSSGRRHRRLELTDVLEYQRRRDALRDEMLTKLVEDAEENGLYDIPAGKFQEALRQVRAERRGDSSGGGESVGSGR